MAYTSIMSVGQSSFDTIELGVVNGGAGFDLYSPLGGCAPIAASAAGTVPAITQPNTAQPVASSFTASNMVIRVTGTGGSGSPSQPINNGFTINGVPGSINAQLTAGLAYNTIGQVFQDTSHSDWIAAGDTVNFCASWASGTGGVCYTGVQWQGSHPSGVALPVSLSMSTAGAAFVPYTVYTMARKWLPALGGFVANTSNPGQSQVVIPSSVTWSGLQLYLDANSAGSDTSTSYFRSYITNQFLATDPADGADGGASGAPGMPYGNLFITFTGDTAPATHADTSHTDWVPSGDLIGVENWESSNQQYKQYTYMSSTFTSASPNVSPCTCVGIPLAGTTTAKQWQQIIATEPRPSTDTAEALSLAPCSGTFSGLNVACGTVGTGASGAFYINDSLDKGTAYGSQALNSISAVGVTSDTSHQDMIPAGDAFANSLFGFDNTFTLNSQSVAFATPEVALVGSHADQMPLMGVG